MSTARVDLVCEGGGVRGIGLVGAVDALAAAGYEFPRVAGSSAGAIVASLVAALQAAGAPLTRLAEIMRSIDYRKFLDRSLIGRVPLIGGGLSLLVSDGVYRGAYVEELLTDLLAELGVRTFGDLRTGEEPDPVRLVAGGHRQRPVPAPAGAHPLGPRVLWHRPGRLLGGTSGARFGGDSLHLRARSGRWRRLGGRAGCCRIFRWTCSTGPNRVGRHSASGCRRVPAFRPPIRCMGRCRWESPRSKRW